MLGAIIGDVAGSTYEVKEVKEKLKKSKVDYFERIKILDKKTPLFIEDSSMTDDSILTIAIADAYLNNISYSEKLREYGLKEYEKKDIYGRSKFGKGFINWLQDESKNNSFGNGCAMRISSIPEMIGDYDEMKEEVYKATIPTHNHPDSIKCAMALSDAIYMAKNSATKKEIKQKIETDYFKLDYDLTKLQKEYEFTSKAIESVPQAIYVFLESKYFEDAIRKAISIGGDSDTIACMVGAISESYYGIPNSLRKEVLKYIPDDYKPMVKTFYKEK